MTGSISRARICKPFNEPRNRFPAWRAGTTRLAESIPWHRFLGSLNVYRYGLWCSLIYFLYKSLTDISVQCIPGQHACSHPVTTFHKIFRPNFRSFPCFEYLLEPGPVTNLTNSYSYLFWFSHPSPSHSYLYLIFSTYTFLQTKPKFSTRHLSMDEGTKS